MRRGFDVEDPIPVAELRSVLQTAKREQVPLGTNGLPFVISRRLNRISSTLPADPDVATLEYINEVMALVQELPFEVDIALLQNRCYEYLQTVYQDHFDSGEEDWVRRFVELCDRLRLQLPQNLAAEIAPIHAA
jgi:hypothetical protein